MPAPGEPVHGSATRPDNLSAFAAECGADALCTAAALRPHVVTKRVRPVTNPVTPR